MNFNDEDDFENGGPGGDDTSVAIAGTDPVTGTDESAAEPTAGVESGAAEPTAGAEPGAPEPTVPPKPAKAARAAAPVRRKLPLEKALDAALAKGDAAEIRLRATKRTMGDARDTDVVYRTTESTARRVADVKANSWLRAQILAGVIEIQG